MPVSVDREANDMLAHRLDHDVAVFYGCSFMEVALLSLANMVALSVLFMALSSSLLGMPLLGFGAALLMTLWLTRVAAKAIGRYKEGKPPGYVKQHLILCFARQGLYRAPYITREGWWSVEKFL